MRAFLAAIVLSAIAVPAQAESREVVGYAGLLGEWELTAALAMSDSGRMDEFSGPLTLKHVGLCTQDGPEERTGELRLQILTPSSRLNATLLVSGIECTYSGRLSDSYIGMMVCPDRPAVPLRLWLKSIK